jgi:diphthamide biosynthesis protein 2
VLIACPENSLLDSKEFYRPIVTPYEVDLACNANREWSQGYILEFQHLLQGLYIIKTGFLDFVFVLYLYLFV